VEIAEALSRLVARSSVALRTAGGDARYLLTEDERAVLGRQYWLQDGLGDLAHEHLAWCEEALCGAEEALARGPGQRSWLDRIALEEANLTAGLSTALGSADAALAARLALGMCAFWELRGPLAEGRALLERVLKVGPLGAGARARLLDGLGRLLLRQGHSGAAAHAFRQALRAATAGGAQLTAARARAHLGLAELCTGRPGPAASAVEQALAELSVVDSPTDLARCRATRALVALAQGRPGDAMADLDRAIALQVGTGEVAGWATSLLYRSLAHLADRRSGRALQDARQAAQLFFDLGDRGGTASSLLAAATALKGSRPAAALELVELSEQLERDGGALPVPALHDMAHSALAEVKRGPWGPARPRLPQELLRSPLDALADACGPVGQEQPDRDQPQAFVQVLGGFQVLWGGAAVHLPPQVGRLVKLVAVSGGQVHVEQAIELLWPEVAPALGKRRLRNVLSKLTRAAGPLVVRAASTLRLGPGVTVDALRFEAAARRALSAARAQVGKDGIGEALAAHRLYSGELLPEDRYEDFAIVVRERLRWLHLRLLDAGAAAAAEAQDYRTAEDCLRAALEIDPTDEDRHVALARHIMSQGRLAAATQALATARTLLASLGLPVSPALLRTEQELLARSQRGRQQDAQPVEAVAGDAGAVLA